MLDPGAYFEQASPLINRLLSPETVTLTRAGRLYSNRNESISTALVKTLASAGATSVILEADDGLLLTGTLLAGTTLAIAGHAASYTVAADAEPAAGGASITVTLTGALSASASVGAAVTLSDGPSYTWTNALVVSTDRRDRGGDPGAELYLLVDLPVLGAPATPAEGDSLLRAYDGSTGRVTRVQPAIAGSWRVQVGVA